MSIMNKRVFVYRNLRESRTEYTYSLRSLEGQDKSKVIARVKWGVLFGPEFVVSEASRLRALEQKQRNVHAGVRGLFRDNGWKDSDWALFWENQEPKAVYRRVSYIPQKGYPHAFFYCDDQRPVNTQHTIAYLTPKGIFVKENRDDKDL